jgi:prophage tail gpP-like protein
VTFFADKVELTVNGETLLINKSYQIECSVFTVPSTFGLRVGHSDTCAQLLRRFQPGMEFRLSINGNVIQVGTIDNVDTGGSSGTEVNIAGRDRLALLWDSYLGSERTFKESTFAALVEQALEAQGYSQYTLTASNAANRQAVTGVQKTSETGRSASAERALEDVTGEGFGGNNAEKSSVIHNTIKGKLGTRWLELIQKQLSRAGLFIWAGTDGSFILSEPNAKQLPSYRIQRSSGVVARGTGINTGVMTPQFRNQTDKRNSKAIVWGRTTGGEGARQKVRGEFVDEEMVAWGINKTIVVDDKDIKTAKEAEYAARRLIAEQRRAGWSLEYTVSGHSTQSLLQPGTRAIWAPDTVVEVKDEFLDINGNFYLSDVSFSRSDKGTTTSLRLMRPEDLVFAEELF